MPDEPNYSTRDGREVYTPGTNPPPLPEPDRQSHMPAPEWTGPTIRATTPEDDAAHERYQKQQELMRELMDPHHEDPHIEAPEMPEIEFGALAPGSDSAGSGPDSPDPGLGVGDTGLASLDSGFDPGLNTGLDTGLDSGFDSGLDSGGLDSADQGSDSDDPGFDSTDGGGSDDGGQDFADPGMDFSDQDYENA